MGRGRLFLLLAAAVVCAAGPALAQRNRLTTYLPGRDIEDYVAAQLDVPSTPSVFNARRETYQTRFMELGLRPQPRPRNRGPLVLAGPDGMVRLGLFERGDRNRDGIEDVLVCLEEMPSRGGRAAHLLVVQKYSADSPLLAIGVGASDRRCR